MKEDRIVSLLCLLIHQIDEVNHNLYQNKWLAAHKRFLEVVETAQDLRNTYFDQLRAAKAVDKNDKETE